MSSVVLMMFDAMLKKRDVELPPLPSASQRSGLESASRGTRRRATHPGLVGEIISEWRLASPRNPQNYTIDHSLSASVRYRVTTKT